MSAEASPILQLCVALFRNMKGRGSVHYRCTFLKVLHFALEIAQQGSHFLFAVYILPFSKCCIFALENYLSLWLIFSSSTTTDKRRGAASYNNNNINFMENCKLLTCSSLSSNGMTDMISPGSNDSSSVSSAIYWCDAFT